MKTFYLTTLFRARECPDLIRSRKGTITISQYDIRHIISYMKIMTLFLDILYMYCLESNFLNLKLGRKRENNILVFSIWHWRKPIEMIDLVLVMRILVVNINNNMVRLLSLLWSPGKDPLTLCNLIHSHKYQVNWYYVLLCPSTH